MNKKILLSLFIFISMILIYAFYSYTDSYLFTQVRLPRLMLTLMVGMSLSGVGSVFQILLNNPLAEPYILGVSSGAALGSIIASLFGILALVPLFGFIGAILSILIVWALAHIGTYFDRSKLLFSGFIYAMFISSLISFLMYWFQKDVAIILQVLMGNLGHIFNQKEWVLFIISFIISIILLVYLYFQSNALNLITTGEDSAQSMGVDVKKLRRNLFISGSLLTGICVSYAGIIGFVGLIIPHFVRIFVGSNQKRVFPFSVLYGASFLLFCDLISVSISVIEFPVGIITAFLGCPLFLYLLLIKKN